MKKYLLILLCLITISGQLSSCQMGVSGGWKDDHIDAKLRGDMAVLDKKLFTSIFTKNVAGVKSLMSPVLIEKAGGKLDSVIKSFGNAFNTTNYLVLNEFYTKNTTTNITNTLFSGLGSADYYINYLALNEEMYASVMVSKGLPLNCMVLAIYGKYDSGWKLNILHVSQYNMQGKNAPDFYNEALDQYKKGNIIDAVNMMVMASELASPGGEYLKYKNDGEMKDFYTKIIKEANTKYKLPVAITQLKSKPQIFAINPIFVDVNGDYGVYPIVKYKSDIALEDTVALKLENKELQKIIPGLFKGIDQDKKYILYISYNQLPSSTASYNQSTPVKQHKFAQKLY